MSIPVQHTLALAAATAFIVACGRTDTYEDTGTLDTATPAAAMPATPATPALTDANIAGLLDEANAADSAAGRLASTKGTDAEVKDFGRMMMNDHHRLRMQGQELAQRLNITPDIPAGNALQADARAMIDSLNTRPAGAEWDRTYIAYEVTAHETVLRTIDDALGATQTQELRTLLEQARPTVQGHLERARAIQTRLAGNTQ